MRLRLQSAGEAFVSVSSPSALLFFCTFFTSSSEEPLQGLLLKLERRVSGDLTVDMDKDVDVEVEHLPCCFLSMQPGCS